MTKLVDAYRAPAGWFVVYAAEHMRDGVEEWGRAFENLDAALDYINKIASGFAGDNCRFALFTLGKRVQLEADDVRVKQPDQITRKFKVRK